MPPDKTAQRTLTPGKLKSAGIVLAGVAVAILVIGITTRKAADARLSKWTEQQAIATVAVAKPDTAGQDDTLILPGRLEAYAQAQMFARVSGYLKAWYVDIGARVKAGQLLAEIDAPDLDQQIMQSEANLANAQANAVLANVTLQRGQSLAPTGVISKQVMDQRIADAAAKEALVRSAKADLDRLRALEVFKRITAPFDGVITARATDVGALINAGGSGGTALFVIADIAKLRVSINVPQNFAPSIKVGATAQLSAPEYPGRAFAATLDAASQAVDPATGTTRMQLVVDNADNELLTGGYVNVKITLQRPDKAINIPASALIFDKSGLRVATVEPSSRVVLKAVTISRDLGKRIEIGSGLSADDLVIETPPDGIATGDEVRIINAQEPLTAAR